MNRLLPIFISGLLLALAACAAPAPEQAADHGLDFEQAKALAAERGVPLLIDFWKDS